MKKITLQQCLDNTEEYVVLSHQEVIYVVDETGMIVRKIQDGQSMSVTPEEIINNM